MTTRHRLHDETRQRIKEAGRSRLAVDGPGLSMRAVARDVDMVSSAVYRYFPSRDDLLTALIIDSYNDMGEAVERAETTISRSDLLGRFRAMAHGLRTWACESPHEYTLIYGSPIPGYDAPQETVAPAMRVITVLGRIVSDGCREGSLHEAPETIDESIADDLRALGDLPPFEQIPPALRLRAVAAWSALYGLVSFELFGSYGPLSDPRALFAHQVDGVARGLGLLPSP